MPRSNGLACPADYFCTRMDSSVCGRVYFGAMMDLPTCGQRAGLWPSWARGTAGNWDSGGHNGVSRAEWRGREEWSNTGEKQGREEWMERKGRLGVDFAPLQEYLRAPMHSPAVWIVYDECPPSKCLGQRLCKSSYRQHRQYIIPTNHACRIVTHARCINRACT